MSEQSRGVFGPLYRMRRIVSLVAVFALSPLLVNCYGRFPLTRTIYRVNGGIPNGLLRQIVFWVFVIVPVYGVAILADAIVLNLIEFWTGADIGVAEATDAEGRTFVLAPTEDGREALLTVSKDGQVLSEVRFVRVSDTTCEVRDSEGRLAGTVVRTAAGELRFTDAEGRLIGVAPHRALLQAQGI